MCSSQVLLERQQKITRDYIQLLSPPVTFLLHLSASQNTGGLGCQEPRHAVDQAGPHEGAGGDLAAEELHRGKGDDRELAHDEGLHEGLVLVGPGMVICRHWGSGRVSR
jgi:hypothetical protein